MRSRLFRLVAVAVAVTVFSTGCMLSRAVDRAFIGITVKRPAFVDRKTTGLFLLPITFAIDVATFPIQALLVVIIGDKFPFHENDILSDVISLNDNPQFQKLGDEQKAVATAEFRDLLQSGKVTPNTAMALNDDGHWVLVPLTADTREQLIARATGPVQAAVAVCSVP